jgi:pyruvate/2-oxoglutarate dehydrogenase complex dihydrolipoamide acyltransferase (E2) component
MITEVRLPQWGMGMEDGTVARWHKAVGDAVEAGDIIAEIETAKTTNELEAPATGVLKEILVGEGEIAEVRQVLALIESD